MSPQFESFLTVREIAELLDYSPKKVRSWLAEGKLKAVKLPGNRQGAEEGEVHRFAAHYLGIDIPPTMRSLNDRIADLENEVKTLKQELVRLTQAENEREASHE